MPPLSLHSISFLEMGTAKGDGDYVSMDVLVFGMQEKKTRADA